MIWNSPIHMAKNSYQQIVEDEKKILDELQKNANKSINDVATSCGFSRQKVWRVIKTLKKIKLYGDIRR